MTALNANNLTIEQQFQIILAKGKRFKAENWTDCGTPQVRMVFAKLSKFEELTLSFEDDGDGNLTANLSVEFDNGTLWSSRGTGMLSGRPLRKAIEVMVRKRKIKHAVHARIIRFLNSLKG